MSAPSKEEIAEFISVVRDFSDGSLAAHAVTHLAAENERLQAMLAEEVECHASNVLTMLAVSKENERLRKTWHIKRCEKWSNGGVQSSDPARRCRLAVDHETDCDFGELERLRAENERLRADRAELLGLLVPFEAYPCDPEPPEGGAVLCGGCVIRRVIAKLRGQQP